MTSPDTNPREPLVQINEASSDSALLPLTPTRKSSHWPIGEHSSPPSSAEPGLSPSLNYALAPSRPRCALFPFVRADFRACSMSWHSAAQHRSGRHWHFSAQDSFPELWVWLREICDVRRSARFFFCYCTLFSSWQPATKSSQILADSSPSLQSKVRVVQLWYRFACISVQVWIACMHDR